MSSSYLPLRDEAWNSEHSISDHRTRRSFTLPPVSPSPWLLNMKRICMHSSTFCVYSNAASTILSRLVTCTLA
eukprot:2455159-Pleurochrysis_carterae.AAC.1